MTGEPDLLLGCLALQRRHVNPLQFAEAYLEWADGQEVPLAEVLERRGLITAAERARLERLVDQRSGAGSKEPPGESPTAGESPPPGESPTAGESPMAGESPTPDESPTAGEENPPGGSPDDLHSPTQTHVSQSRSSLQAAAEPPREALGDTQDFSHPSRSRYTLTRVHGTGGLGRVWLAWDEHLQREVALKEILPSRGKHPNVKRRLVKEAQITGQLEHPNIVPVYELVNAGPEESFYTMRFVRGETLRAQVRDYYKGKHASVSDQMEMRRLLTAFVNICHAVGYAHARGVLHRDLKPDNVMLGDYGEVIVLDWGLAQLTEQRDADVDMRTVQVGSSGAVTMTREGTALGSPAYMSPEQADGRRSLIDPRTDVYGLGGILFAILTGEVPHRGNRSGDGAKDTWELLASISRDPTPLARTLNPKAPRALEAICAKAMAKRQADRYQSAQELGEEVQRWLADEPVAAYREPLLERLGRWTRRHRSATLSAAAALLLVASVSVVSALLVDASRRAEADARRTAEAALTAERAAKQEATRRFAQARNAVDKSLTGVSRVLQHFPATQTLRTRLLEQAAADYRSFADSTSEDTQLQLESARTWIRLGDVHRTLDDHTAAAESYQTAARLLRGREDRFLPDPAGRRELGSCLVRLAETQWHTGAEDQSRKGFAEARRILEELVAESPDEPENRLGLATLLLNAAPLTLRDQPESAIEQLNQAEREFLELANDHPEREHQHGLAEARHRIGRFFVELGRHQPAVLVLRRAEEGYAELVGANPDDPPLLEGLAACRVNLASAQRLAGDDVAAEASYERAVGDYRVLVNALPGIPAYWEQQALAHTNRAQLLMQLGATATARPDAEAAVSAFNDLVASAPQLARYLDGLGRASLTYGLVLRDLGEYELALRAFDMAAEEYRQLVAADPRAATYQRHLAIAGAAAARTHAHLGDPDAAAELFRDATDTLDALLEKWPDDERSVDTLAWCLTWHADLLAGQQKNTVARDRLRQALRHRGSVQRLPDHRASHVWLLANGPDVELREPGRAVDAAAALVGEVPDNARYQFLLALAHYRNRDWAASRQALDAARENRSQPNAMDLYLLALLQVQQGQAEDARKSMEQAERLQKQNRPGNLELRKFREEVVAALQSAEAPLDGDAR